jgi:glucan 1,3-beta-glucosidase
VSAARGVWLLTLGVALAANLGYWWHAGRPQDLVAAPADKLACVSYTPFRGSESPFDTGLVVPPERIEEDLARLAPVADCLRTYATDQGLAAVPEIAARHGLQVLLGIWIGRDAAANRLQIDTAIALARAHPDTIRGIIVGNEVLLRGEQSGATLAKLLREVKAATGKPVTYADVWEFWLRAPAELAAAADFLTIHVLPYWEDAPVAAADGIAHLETVLAKVEAAFPGKPMLIGETGWPSAGRQRSAAVPARLEQARYIRAFLAYAAAHGLDYNLIEAFDQPWKRRLEGTVGGHWGILDADRGEKFPFSGPVSEEPDWAAKAAAATLLGLLLLASQSRALRQARAMRAGALPMVAVAAGALLLRAAEHSFLAARNPAELAVEAALIALSALIAWALLGRIADPSPRRPVAIAEVAADLRSLPAALADPARRLDLLQIFAVAGALCASLALVFDPRYRDFPIAAFALPAVGLAIDAMLRRDWLQHAAGRSEEALFSLLLLGAACWIAVAEGPANRSALVWAGLSILLALPWIGAWRGFTGDWRPVAIAAAAR